MATDAPSSTSLLRPLAEDLRERRERWGFSYFTVREESMTALAPLVSELAGT